MGDYLQLWVNVKFSHTHFRALGPILIPVYRQSAHRWLSHPPGGRLPFRQACGSFLAKECHHSSAGTKLYCLVTEVRACEQLAQGCYPEADRPTFEPAIFWVASERSTAMPHRYAFLLWVQPLTPELSHDSKLILVKGLQWQYSVTVAITTARVLASQAEAIVRTRKTWPQATQRRTGD